MFYLDGIFRKSTLLDEIPGIYHGFSAKEGGVSSLPHTRSMNLAKGRGDDDETVVQNIEIFARALSDGSCGAESVVMASQIHSAEVRIVTRENGGEGVVRTPGEYDGFATCEPGVIPVARTADCVPILLAGVKSDGQPHPQPVVAAVHAGWKGTLAGIAGEAVRKMRELGCDPSTIRAAIGPHIRYCCYEVGEDFFNMVRDLRGEDFAARHIAIPEGKRKHHADLASINIEFLTSAGVKPDFIDVSPDCTMCMSDVYYSHRATQGKRGAMGAGIGIR